NSGLRKIQAVFTEHEIEEHFEDDELVQQLRETRESLREEYNVGLTLNEQLEKAIADEQYERAAELRDQIESA
ncbi:MAG: UvrB/UvrC motif-containing protein, partial [Planctomycetota bacterium]|nr:UvrB/UvrC motif-containing protein [Planctomycetota bacterium]